MDRDQLDVNESDVYKTLSPAKYQANEKIFAKKKQFATSRASQDDTPSKKLNKISSMGNVKNNLRSETSIANPMSITEG